MTDSQGRTHHNTQWGENVTHKASGTGKNLCTSDCIHVYDHPLKAAFFNPIHAKFTNPILWEAKVKDIVARDTTKVGVRQCTTIRQVPLSTITINQRVRVAILVALSLPHTKKFDTWAEGWLNDKDRTYAAAAAATYAFSYASYLAANAAYNAVDVAYATYAADVAAVDAATAASYATAYLATASLATASLVSIIKKALKEEKS